MSRYAVLADIHGNLYALKSVMEDISSRSVDKIILLGDLVDYGMQSNEVIDFINKELHIPIMVNIWGNHEKAIIDKDFSRFSGNRGVESAKYTEKTLSESNKSYLRNDPLAVALNATSATPKPIAHSHLLIVSPSPSQSNEHPTP